MGQLLHEVLHRFENMGIVEGEGGGGGDTSVEEQLTGEQGGNQSPPPSRP